MSPTPLHQLAENGRASLAQRSASVESKLANEVRSRVTADGRMSVNMTPARLEGFLDGEPRLNAFALAAAQATSSGHSAAVLLRQILGPFHNRRVDFEQHCGAGRHFHYGALNIGGMGIPRYGRYCVVDGRAFGDTEPDPVWIAEDSITGARFRTPEETLVWNRLANWVAPWDCAAELAIVKLGDGEPSTEPTKSLEARVCDHDDYIEALSLAPIVLAQVAEIRSEVDDAVQDRALAAVLDGAAAPEQLDLDLHERLRRKASELRIRWAMVRP